jgi:hypothetical protein
MYLYPYRLFSVVWLLRHMKKVVGGRYCTRVYAYIVVEYIRVKDMKGRDLAYSAPNPRPHDGYCMGQPRGECVVHIHNSLLTGRHSLPPLLGFHFFRNDIGGRKVRIGQCKKICKQAQNCKAAKQGDVLARYYSELSSRPIMPYETGQALLGTIRHYSDIQATYKPL